MHSFYQATLPPRESQPTAGFTSIEVLCFAFSSSKTPKETELEPTRVQCVAGTTGDPNKATFKGAFLNGYYCQYSSKCPELQFREFRPSRPIISVLLALLLVIFVT